MSKLFFTIMAFSSFVVSAEIAVVVHPLNSSALDKDGISKLYLGKVKSFPDGASAIPIALPEGVPITAEFNQKVLNRQASQLKAYWSRLIFTGKGNPPKEVATDAEVLELVSKNPNVIGYMDAKAVNDSVRVIGKF